MPRTIGEKVGGPFTTLNQAMAEAHEIAATIESGFNGNVTITLDEDYEKEKEGER